MSGWTTEDLNRLAAAREIDVIATRPDGSPGKPVVVWPVRQEDDLYLRSYRGEEGVWYQSVLADPHGKVSLDGISHDVVFEHIGKALAADINAAYTDKYKDLPTYVEAMVHDEVQATTLRIVPVSA